MERELIFEVSGQNENLMILAEHLKRIGITMETAEGGREGQKIIRWDDSMVEKRISREAGNVWVKEDIKIQDVIDLMDKYWIRGQHGTFGKEHLGISKSTFRRRLRYFEDKYGSLQGALEAGGVYFTDSPEKNKTER